MSYNSYSNAQTLNIEYRCRVSQTEEGMWLIEIGDGVNWNRVNPEVYTQDEALKRASAIDQDLQRLLQGELDTHVNHYSPPWER